LQAIGPELTFYDSLKRPTEPLLVPERLVRARMNAFSRLCLRGEDLELNANLNAFTIESSSGVSVVEPFDATVKYSKVSGKQNIHVSMSEIYTNFSFSILQLILRLQDDVMAFMRITSEQITVECSEFDRIWVDDRKDKIRNNSTCLNLFNTEKTLGLIA
jgi:vacuolar protein sorting-associated protein 13A/C